MDQSSAGPESTELGPTELGYGAWIAFWAQLAVLGGLAVLGAAFASANRDPGDYACGLVLSLAAIALAWMRLKNRLDARGDEQAGDWRSFLLVDDMANLVAAIVIFTVLALAGLFVAAGVDHGGLHDSGIALFLASGVAVFLSLKHFFDNLDRQH